MSDWSQLPTDLLERISDRLNTDFDILRFRSVCSSWRSSVPLKHHRLPGRFPILPNDGISETTWGFYLSKRTIFRLGLPVIRRGNDPGTSSEGWIIKVEEDIPETMHLLNPLSKTPIKPLPESFPKVLDISDFQISELGQEYVLQYINYRPFANSLRDTENLYMEKVVFSRNSLESDEYLVLTIHVSGKLAMFRSGDKRWTIIEDLPSPYDDVIRFKEKFYAVDSTGRTVVVDPSPTVTEIASSVFGGDKKCLVESDGELLLVDMYLSTGPDDDPNYGEGDEFFEHIDSYVIERTVWFKVFKLDQSKQKWVEVKSLGDRVLFLGDNSSFSASSCDFSGCKGNCIYYTDSFFHSNLQEDDGFKHNDIGVFDLETGNIGPLASYPGYSKLFWPPPAWLHRQF